MGFLCNPLKYRVFNAVRREIFPSQKQEKNKSSRGAKYKNNDS